MKIVNLNIEPIDLNYEVNRRFLAESLYDDPAGAIRECDQAHIAGDCPLCGGICHMVE
jgi:hypothetical protein